MDENSIHLTLITMKGTHFKIDDYVKKHTGAQQHTAGASNIINTENQNYTRRINSAAL